MRFAKPVSVTAGVPLIASYFAPRGRYAATPGYFTAARTSGALTAAAGANGVYSYGTTSQLPQQSYRSTNYWVDVVFQTSVNDTAPPTVTARTPAPDSTGVLVGTAVSATFDEAVTGGQIALTGPPLARWVTAVRRRS